MPRAGWYTLRHTYGVLRFRHGANAVQVQRRLGHHSPAFTLAVYVQIARRRLVRVTRRGTCPDPPRADLE